MLWFDVAPSDAAEKTRNIGAQLQSITCINAPKTFGKFTSCITFGAHKLVHSEPFLGSTRSIEPNSYGNVAGWVGGWMGGWLAGWLSVTAGIVSKRLNLS